jgi:hypothetical protein
MIVELIGGPLDGTLVDGPINMPFCVSFPTACEAERAIYRASCGCGCHRLTDKSTPFFFSGYDICAASGHLEEKRV